MSQSKKTTQELSESAANDLKNMYDSLKSEFEIVNLKLTIQLRKVSSISVFNLVI